MKKKTQKNTTKSTRPNKVEPKKLYIALGVAVLVGLSGVSISQMNLGGSNLNNQASTSSQNNSSSGGDQGGFRYDHSNDQYGVAIGNANAPVTIREFADYECPACRQFSGVTKRVINEYVDSGDVRFIFFDFPLRMHEHAETASQAARCAGRQDEYWEMHDALYDNQPDWSGGGDPVGKFAGYADDIGIDGDQLEACIEDDLTAQAVRDSKAVGNRIGVRSTPSVIIENEPYSGFVPYDSMKEIIESKLGQ